MEIPEPRGEAKVPRTTEMEMDHIGRVRAVVTFSPHVPPSGQHSAATCSEGPPGPAVSPVRKGSPSELPAAPVLRDASQEAGLGGSCLLSITEGNQWGSTIGIRQRQRKGQAYNKQSSDLGSAFPPVVPAQRFQPVALARSG